MARALLSAFLVLVFASAAFADALVYKNSRFGTRISFSADVVRTMDLSYPDSLRAKYDALAGIIARSLEGP